MDECRFIAKCRGGSNRNTVVFTVPREVCELLELKPETLLEVYFKVLKREKEKV